MLLLTAAATRAVQLRRYVRNLWLASVREVSSLCSVQELRPEEVSLLERCPHFRGCSTHVYTCFKGTGT